MILLSTAYAASNRKIFIQRAHGIQLDRLIPNYDRLMLQGLREQGCLDGYLYAIQSNVPPNVHSVHLFLLLMTIDNPEQSPWRFALQDQ